MTDKLETKRTLLQSFSWLSFIIGIIVGLVLFVALRIALAKPDITHYHANFGLFIEGERDKFNNFTFYEEVQSCSSEDDNNPRHRVHMHNNVSDTVHVHAPAATWGHFFANLGYGLVDDAVKTDKGVFVDGVNDKKLTLLLNGEEVDDVSNRVIESEDVLLVSYGDPADAKDQYSQIGHTAHESNTKPDPASCSGSENLTFEDRIKQALDFTK